jgi:hypothetical protein
MFYVSNALLNSYKIASLSFMSTGFYSGMMEIEFRFANPGFAGLTDITGRAVAEDIEGGEVYLMYMAGPPTSPDVEDHIKKMLKELVNQLNKEVREGAIS